MRPTVKIVFGVCALASSITYAAIPTVAGFEGGADDGFTGNAFFEATGGNPGGAARHTGDLFFNELRTGAEFEPANPDFLGDYSHFGSVTISVDVKTNMLDDFFGDPISRPVGVKLIDRDIMGPDGPSGVWFELGTLGVNFTPNWTTLSVFIADTTSTALPPGWVGFGDEDPITFEPRLPPGATFASVLAGVDEFDITGNAPGFFFTDAFWDVQVDNISIVPEPGVATLLIAGLGSICLKRRRAALV